MYFNVTAVLAVLNLYRSYHCVPSLAVNANLTNYAQNWSNTLAKNNRFNHSYGPYGENLALIGVGARNTDDKTSVVINAIDLWYSEIRYYNWSNPMYNSKTGHFSQVIWKTTQEVGFAISAHPRGIIITSEYFPPGNIASRYYFSQNVKALCVPPFPSPPPFMLFRARPRPSPPSPM